MEDGSTGASPSQAGLHHAARSIHVRSPPALPIHCGPKASSSDNHYEMLDQLIHALVHSGNEAADAVLLEALRLGTDAEKALSLNALLQRKTTAGLTGVIGLYDRLPAALQAVILQNIKAFHSALRECGRSSDPAVQLAAARLIALGRQGKLTYVLIEVLHSPNETVARGAVEAIVAMSRWVATESRRLQREEAAAQEAADESAASYQDLMDQRPEIEAAVARAIDVHRGRHGQELLRACLLLADWPGSRTLAILHTAKHGGQSPMVRRLQQPPDSEHVDAFLLGASHGGLRSHFGIAFSHIEEAPVLDALLRRTHWLKDHQLQLCMHQVSRGVWWGESELLRELTRRVPEDSARIGEWLATSGVHDVVQDERLERLREHAGPCFEARVRLLRIALRRPRGASVTFLRSMLNDADERLMRIAAREIVRRRPPDFENALLQLMTSAPESVRRVIGRSVGQAGFEQYWTRFDRLDRDMRRSAGRAMLKILPDAVARLTRRLTGGTPEQRLKAIQIVQELEIGDAVGPTLMQLCQDQHPKVRSKAVAALADVKTVPNDTLLERVLHDSDARVRANAIEVLETRQSIDFVPLLTQRARAANNRERANAIKALHSLKVGAANQQLANMMRDDRPEHRISALWALRRIGFWKLLNEVVHLARDDNNLRVRRYALAILRGLAEQLHRQEASA